MKQAQVLKADMTHTDLHAPSPRFGQRARWLAALGFSLVAVAPAWSAGTTPTSDALVAQARDAEPVPEHAGNTSVWLIRELQAQALKTAPAVQTARLLPESAEGRLMTARMYPNPTVDIITGQSRLRAGSPLTGNVTEIMVEQPLEWPAAREARIDGATAGLVLADRNRLQIINDVLADVRLRSLEWLVRQEEIRFLQDALDLIEQTRNRIAVKVDSGEAARYELIKAEAEVLSARSRLDAVRAQAAFTRARLSQILGVRLGEAFRIEAPSRYIPDAVDVDKLVAKVVATNPELKAREAEVEQQEQRLREQKVLRRPAVAVQARTDQEPELRTRQVGVAVTVPIFDTRAGIVREAAAEAQISATRLEARRYELTQQTYATHATLVAAKRRVEALEGGVLKQAEAALAVAQAAYKFGERGILDTLDAQRVLRTVRSDLTAARLEAFSAATELDRLSGAYLELMNLVPAQP